MDKLRLSFLKLAMLKKQAIPTPQMNKTKNETQ